MKKYKNKEDISSHKGDPEDENLMEGMGLRRVTFAQILVQYLHFYMARFRGIISTRGIGIVQMAGKEWPNRIIPDQPISIWIYIVFISSLKSQINRMTRMTRMNQGMHMNGIPITEWSC